MPKKTPSFPTNLFKKRLSDPLSSGSPKTPTRSPSWLVTERFRSTPIEDFQVECLGSRSGHLVFGPLSVFNGIISFNVKQRIPGVAVSITFRGLTEFNGKQLAFINETETVWQGDLEPGLRTFYFALRFPPLNLPPSCNEPELGYNFIAQIKPRTDIEKDMSSPIGEPRIYTSKPLELTFIPYVDPFAPSRYDTMLENNSLRRNDSGKFGEDIFFAEGEAPPGVKPLLKLTTANLPTSSPPPGPETKSYKPMALPNLPVEDGAKMWDGHNRPMAKLRVKIEKQRYIPGDEVSFLLALTLPEGGNVPKNFNASVIEKRWLGFESDEDADEVSDFNPEVSSKTTKSGRIYTRNLTATKYPLNARDAVRLQKATDDPKESKDSKESEDSKEANRKGEDFVIENAIEIVERVSVRLPNFKTFVDSSLLPSASLPLGTCFAETSPMAPGAELGAGSIKGKEPIRPASRRTVSTTISTQSNIIQGLHLDVSHFLHISVPLTSGILKKTSGTVEVYLPIILGNKTSDVDWSHHKNKPQTPELKVTTPELVISSPNELHELKREGSKASFKSFKREPSPLKISSSAYNLDGLNENEAKSSNNTASAHGSQNGSIAGVNGGNEKKLVMFNHNTGIRWRRGERFPTLEEAIEGPVFIKS